MIIRHSFLYAIALKGARASMAAECHDMQPASNLETNSTSKMARTMSEYLVVTRISFPM